MADRTALRVIATDTTVKHVTFFEDRAEVVRTARCRVPSGRSFVHARGLGLLVDDRSLTTSGGGGNNVDVVSSRVRRRAWDTTEASAEEIMAIEAEAERLRDRMGGLDRLMHNASADGRRVAKLLELWEGSVRETPSRATEAREELERSYSVLDARLIGSIDKFARLRTEREDAEAELSRANARLAQGRTKKPRYEAFAEIEINAAADTDLVLEITYRTPCALWRPEHLARYVSRGNAGGEISITTYATVWQFTGETWHDVPCRFSTARPARSATAPQLREDIVMTRKKSDHERSKIVIEAREQAIAAAGVSRGVRDVEEMPGVEDGGEAQWLDARSPATIESDGKPVRVEIGTRTVPCSIARVAFPELGPATHLRATATLQGSKPLLAGPVVVGRETEIVGRSRLKFVGAGEPFELGFGTDDALRVRRKVVDKRKTTQVTGTQHVSREISIYVSNLSGEERSLSVIERVPVSEVEDVVIEVQKQPHMRHDARDGFATFELTLRPRETREVRLEYRLEAKSNVVLPPSLDA